MRTTTNTVPLLVPQQIHELLIDPVRRMSVATQVAEVVMTNSHTVRFPVVTQDPSAAWCEEGHELVVSDGQIEEIEARLTKLAGITIVTNELAEDSSPEASRVVGEGLARDIARKLDEAFFGNLSAPAAQKGLGALTGVSQVASATLDNLDAFAQGRALAELNGSTVRAWVAHPDNALALDMLKAGTGSNAPLLAADAMSPNVRRVLGTDLFVSPYVDKTVIWGIPNGATYVVMRTADAEIDVDKSVFFTSDRAAIRAKLRLAFAFANPGAVVKINVAS